MSESYEKSENSASKKKSFLKILNRLDLDKKKEPLIGSDSKYLNTLAGGF